MDLTKIKEFSKNILEDDRTGHDWRHALRVEKNASRIIPSTLSQEDVEIVRAASWLHDTIDDKIAIEKRISIAEVQSLLQDCDATETQIDEIIYIIQNLSFSKNLNQKRELSIAGQIVQDADRLDAIGAIGIARAFYYGGSKEHALYDDTRPRKIEEITEENYRTQNSVVNHFFEKLLILKDSMNTKKGKEEAEDRTEIMEAFLEDLFDEIKDT